METFIPLMAQFCLLLSAILPLCEAVYNPAHLHTHLPRLVVTVTETSTAPGLTSTATDTSTASTQTSTSTSSITPSIPEPSGGPQSSPILFFIALAVAIALILLAFFYIIRCFKKRAVARKAPAAAAVQTTNPEQGHESQPAFRVGAAGDMEIQPAAAQEFHGYYAPAPALALVSETNEQAAMKKREVYG